MNLNKKFPLYHMIYQFNLELIYQVISKYFWDHFYLAIKKNSMQKLHLVFVIYVKYSKRNIFK